jgi:hypothetical protein
MGLGNKNCYAGKDQRPILQSIRDRVAYDATNIARTYKDLPLSAPKEFAHF